MTEENKEPIKEEPKAPPTYRDRIDGLLSRVSKGEKVFEKPVPPIEPVVQINPTYKKMKELGGLQKGLPELFKIEESAFDVPHYTDDEEDEIVGTKLFKVKPPSNHPDADEYWAKISPHLKRIGKLIPHEGEKPGRLEMEVVDAKGEIETLKITLVRDEENGDRPTLVFEYVNRDDLTATEVTKLVDKAGLKPDRMSSKQHRGIIIMDVVDK